ncbi:MAG: hypothetical protein SVT56_07295 [Chloroflexota bacterium]|nr:hypothetical protein [Chloroflexota bacterium]
MKTIKTVLSNTLTLALLLTIVAGALWFFSRPTPDSQPVAQEATSPLPTPTLVSDTATPLPTVEVTTTPTPVSTGTLPDDQIEPTWTSVIVYPEEPPPPSITPFPTPTPTPLNPNEQELITFDTPASIGAVSPDGKKLAFNTLQIKTDPGVNPYSQVWILDLASKQSTKVVELGAVGNNQVWSPDGKKLAYQLFSSSGIEEIRVIDLNGEQNDTSLVKNENLLGYYWINTDSLSLIRTNSIDQVDSKGQVLEKEEINLPTGNSDPENFVPKPKVAGHPAKIIVVEHNHQLLVRRANNQIITLSAEGNDQYIYDFELSPNGQQIAYLISNDPYVELWISNIFSQQRRKLFELKDRSLRLMTWSPNSQGIIIGWSYTGTNLTGGLTPIWIDIGSGQAKQLGIDEINVGLTVDPNGQSLYYGRTTFYQNLNSDQEKTTFYTLKVE